MLSSCGQTAAQRTDNPKGLPFVRRLFQFQKNFGYTEYILIDCCGKPNSKLCHRFQQSNITKAKAPFYALVILVHPEDKLTISRSNLEILRESIPLIGIKLNKNQVINASGIKTKKGKVMVVDDNSRRANLLKEELNSKNYQVDIFLGSDNYKKALDALETYSVDSPCIVIADERLGLISGGGRTGLLGEYAESGLLFCYGLMKAYPSIVKATMVIAAIKGYSTLHGFYNVGALREVVNSLGISATSQSR